MTTAVDNLPKFIAEIDKLKDAPLVERFPDREGGLLVPNHSIADLKSLAAAYKSAVDERDRLREFCSLIDTADTEHDICVKKFNGKWKAQGYDEDGTVLVESAPYNSVLEAFEAIKP